MGRAELNENNKHQLNQFKKLSKGLLFKEFVEGPTNKLAFETCKAIVDQLGDSKHNPLFLYGGSGLGKTHLIQAVGHAVLHKMPNASVMYLTAAQIVTEFANESQPQRVGQLSQGYRDLDLLLIDDFELLAGKSSHLDDFFNMVNDLLKEFKQVVIASNLYPKKIDALDANLLSQLSSALSVEIEPPELENRVDILLRHSKQHNYELPNDFALCIAQHVLGSVRELEDALNQVIAAAKIQGVEISIEIIQETLKDQFPLRAKQIRV